ncbi:MAG: hypothetical protein A3I00_05905 [Betaproteobacteria bacterium RIFCSPLOWO2_02_FULL_64_12]|nr:MAG: hypothetical protein A3I00_05905 [Betaproteobacteria bacterium RIFCSPLOWO2_02_FULL_64_12]
MTRLWIAVGALALGVVASANDVYAARLGGGRSAGAQRSMVMPRQATPPAQQQAAPKPAQAPAAGQPPATGNRWLGPLAGLAAGLGLGWLLGQSGMSGVLGGILMAGLVAIGLIFLLRLFARRRAQAEPSMQYAGLGSETVAAPPPSQMPTGDALAASASQSGEVRTPVPAGFDTEGFLKQAKLNFLRMQAANDRGELDAIRDVTTDEMFQTLRRDIAARGAAQQHTDVSALNASLLEVVTEGSAYWASVRFYGSMREEDNQAPKAFEEVWHLSKPVTGGAGWLLAGIQQVS